MRLLTLPPVATVVAGVAVVAAGCGTEIGNPELNLAALARTTQPDDVGIEEGPGIAVDEAVVTLRDVKFDTSEVCDSGQERESEIEGPWTVDLVAVDALPVALEGRSFCRVRLRLDRADGGALDDVSVRIAGRRADDVPFVIESRDTPDLDLRARGADTFTLDADAQELLLAFDVARWLDIDLDGLTPETDGTIRIDDDTNRDTLDAFDEALEDSLELFEDLEGDRSIDDDDAALATAG